MRWTIFLIFCSACQFAQVSGIYPPPSDAAASGDYDRADVILDDGSQTDAADSSPADSYDPIAAQIDVEMANLHVLLPTFAVVQLPQAGVVAMTTAQSYTIDDLRYRELDSTAWGLGAVQPPYSALLADDCAPGEEPYVAAGIGPFRLDFFNNEFNYSGLHTMDMADYSSTHGYNIIDPWVRSLEQRAHLPAPTTMAVWRGFDWKVWMSDQQIGPMRYDQMLSLDLVAAFETSAYFDGLSASDFDQLMIDLEHDVLAPEDLRGQPWYPVGDVNVQNAFETQYYDGYAWTYIAAAQAARNRGFDFISFYGWQPRRGWWDLPSFVFDPAGDWRWNNFGKQIYDRVDALNQSVYCFYWNPQNVAYTLATNDINRRYVDINSTRKPLRPYYWPLLHGGSAEIRWWTNQPLMSEEVRAMFAGAFFTGIDGVVLWNWSGSGSHQVALPITLDSYLMLKNGFSWTPEAPAVATPVSFGRYDVVHVSAVDDVLGTVTFQKIEPTNSAGAYGLTPDKPFFKMPQVELRGHLRPLSEPVAATVEGIALVKPVEAALRFGTIIEDIASQEQFTQNLPVVRHIASYGYHIILTYDPGVVYGNAPRSVVLNDFAGRSGLTLTLPSDEQTRIFVLMD